MSDFSLEPEPPPEPTAAVPAPDPPPSPPPAESSPGAVRIPPTVAPGTDEPVGLPLRRKVVRLLTARGLGPATLAVGSLAVGAVGALCLAIQHQGFGAILALGAVWLAWLARTPRAETALPEPTLPLPDWRPFIHGVTEATGAALLAGFALGHANAAMHAMVRVALLAAFLLLPLLRRLDTRGALPKGAVVLSWVERHSLLWIGTLLGNPALIALLVLALVVVDLLVRLVLLRPRVTPDAGLPPSLAGCFDAQGSLLPAIRWAVLAIGVLLCVVFGTEDAWRF